MSHFYGVVQGSRGPATRAAGAGGGLSTVAASWHGAIQVMLYVNEQGMDCYRITEKPWHGAGVSRVIEEGIIGNQHAPKGTK